MKRPAEQGTRPALLIRGLSKSFGDIQAVDHVDLAIPVGSFYGLVGPNGAGKTTLLSMAVGLLRPDGGGSQVLGYDMWTDPVPAKTLLGVLPDHNSLPQRLSGQEMLTYLGLLRGMGADVVRDRSAELFDALGLAESADRLVADYSTGMSKKIALAVALLHGPRVLVLDEPFEAVDPVSAAGMRSILNGFTHSGGTVVFSSHVMALVEQLCDHVAILSDGRLRASGTVEQVRDGKSLDDAFAAAVGAVAEHQELSWFGS